MTKQQEEVIMDLIFKETNQAAHEEESLQDYFECQNDYLDGKMNV